MERRVIRLEERRARSRRASAVPDPPIDWRRVPWMVPEPFAALSEEEKREWGELMANYSAPDAWRRPLSDPIYGRLSELDTRVDWHWDAGLSQVWEVKR